jgi:hypothetical protein
VGQFQPKGVAPEVQRGINVFNDDGDVVNAFDHM